MREFLPEGSKWGTEANTAILSSEANIEACVGTGTIVEAICVACDDKHNMLVDLNGIEGFIPRIEGALGIEEGTVRDVGLLTKVGKPISFVVTKKTTNSAGKVRFELSRRKLQTECFETYIKKLEPGTVINAKVTHLANFGSFVDVGVGIVSLIPLDRLSVSRIRTPADRFKIGQNIHAVVTGFVDNKLQLSHKELLGTWQENADMFEAGTTVVGIVRSIETYGIFVELAPNLAGLAEVKEDIEVGQYVSVFIKSIIPDKCKVKLVIVDKLEEAPTLPDLKYFITEGKLSEWNYTTEESPKQIKTVF